MGQKNQKGTVSITNANQRIRLRWRYQGIRYSLNLFHFSKLNILLAKKIALLIESDIFSGSFDSSLQKYKPQDEIFNGLQEKKDKELSSSIIEEVKSPKTIVQHFESWTKNYRQMDCDVNIHYNAMRSLLRKWEPVTEDNILSKLNDETFGAVTFNERLNMLKSFCKWLVKSKIWKTNPVEDVARKKVKKVKNPSRKPFTELEIKKILDAIQTDKFCHKSSRYKHSHYYPFVYFIFKTGVRNAEAIGLRVGSVNFVNRTIEIKEALARTLKGTNPASRIRKETKNGKERVLPLTKDLEELLLPLIKGKDKDDLVFTSYQGLAIDDHNFQRRLFKKVLASLKIQYRVLYAARHSFGSRCIEAGITPVMTAFLMGNNPETALRNYTHQMNIPKHLPEI